MTIVCLSVEPVFDEAVVMSSLSCAGVYSDTYQLILEAHITLITVTFLTIIS